MLNLMGIKIIERVVESPCLSLWSSTWFKDANWRSAERESDGEASRRWAVKQWDGGRNRRRTNLQIAVVHACSQGHGCVGWMMLGFGLLWARGWAVGAAFWARGCTWGVNLIATIVFWFWAGCSRTHVLQHGSALRRWLWKVRGGEQVHPKCREFL